MAGLVVNVDIDTLAAPFFNEISKRPELKKEDLYPFIDQYANTQITDLALNTFGQYSATPSKIFTDAIFKHAQKEENGEIVDYSDWYKGICEFYAHGIDPYEVWFKRCKDLGLISWMSIRMNDCHEPDAKASFLRSEFFYEAQKNGWMIGKKYGYFRNCFDYSFPAVREKMLAYIDEQLSRYDVYGLELDFQREIFCFPYLNGRYEHIMTDFMRKVRAIADEIGEKRGHRIKIMIRLNRDINHNLVFGFDAETYMREGLVDIIAVCPRWGASDNAMPIDDWKRRASESGTQIYAGIEDLVNWRLCYNRTAPEVAKGLAAEYLCMGADKIYLFNFFSNPLKPSVDNISIWNTCGELETATEGKRRHVVSPQDIAPEGYERYAPLPMDIPAGEKRTLDLHIAPVKQGRALTVKLGISGEEPKHVKLCGLECGAPVLSDCEYSNGKLSFYDYLVPCADFPANVTLEISNSGNETTKVSYAEISVQ